MPLRNRVPALLVLLRLGLGPAILGGAVSWPGWGLVAMLTAGVISDIFDGIIARRLGVATPALRQADSAVDVLFWVRVFGAVWRRVPGLLWQHALVIGAFLAMEVACQVLCLARFRRLVATHTYAAKSWGLVLFAGFAVLLFAPNGLTIILMCLYGIAVDIEIFGILVLAARYPIDIPSIRVLLRPLGGPRTRD
jgi:CDP-diacylglycerol--glycerol-3-phosphate 3-phosphatidyltransferase